MGDVSWAPVHGLAFRKSFKLKTSSFNTYGHYNLKSEYNKRTEKHKKDEKEKKQSDIKNKIKRRNLYKKGSRIGEEKKQDKEGKNW